MDKNIIELLTEDQLLEMSNIRPEESGLPMVIWLNPKSGSEKHGPRIKVQLEHGEKVKQGEWVTVTISDTPEIKGTGLSGYDFELVSKFITTNKDILLKYWNDEINITSLLKGLK